MKLPVNDIQEVISWLRLRSHDGCLYTVEVLWRQQWCVLCDGAGQVLRYRSMEAARRDLAALKVQKCTLLQASSYHEMIGLPEQQVAPMEVPVRWSPL